MKLCGVPQKTFLTINVEIVVTSFPFRCRRRFDVLKFTVGLMFDNIFRKRKAILSWSKSFIKKGSPKTRFNVNDLLVSFRARAMKTSDVFLQREIVNAL